MPNAVRSMVVVAEKPVCTLPLGSVIGPFGANHVEHHGLGDAVQRQVSGHAQVIAVLGHAGAGECGRGHGGDIEKVRAFEVRVARVHARVDGVNADGGRNGGLGDVGFVVDDGGFHISKAAMNFGHAHVHDAEVDFAVVGIGDPGGGLREREGRREGQNAGENCQPFHFRKAPF